MVKIFSFLLFYFGGLLILIANKCWIILATIFIVGFIVFIYSLKTAEICPKELNDLYD